MPTYVVRNEAVQRLDLQAPRSTTETWAGTNWIDFHPQARRAI
jgi:hypothetical protein